MVLRLELKLKCREALSYQMASLFHGVLMELLPEEYADELHYSQLHPYTQHLECREDVWYWVVCALNEQAVKNSDRCIMGCVRDCVEKDSDFD